MIENLIAEFIGVIFTIFVLEELMRRIERRNHKQQLVWEEEKRRAMEEPILRELEFTVDEILENMARVWTPILAPEDRLENAPFYGEKLKEALHRGGLPLKNKKMSAATEYISELGKSFLREGTHLYGLYRMVPDLKDVTKEFIEINNCLSTLQANSQFLERSEYRLLEAQQTGKETEIKKFMTNLYFAKGAVQSNAWTLFAVTKKISEKIGAKVEIPADTTEGFEKGPPTFENGPPTWGEVIVGLFKKRGK